MKRAAKPTDWKIKPMPPERSTISLDRAFTPEEMERIRMGVIPREMEDKWFIYWKDDVLLLHRLYEFPTDEPSLEKRALQSWALLGRAMLGQFPDDE